MPPDRKESAASSPCLKTGGSAARNWMKRAILVCAIAVLAVVLTARTFAQQATPQPAEEPTPEVEAAQVITEAVTTTGTTEITGAVTTTQAVTTTVIVTTTTAVTEAEFLTQTAP